MIIKQPQLDTIRGSIHHKRNAKGFLDAVEEKCKESNKAEITNLMSSFMNTKYGNVRRIRNSY